MKKSTRTPEQMYSLIEGFSSSGKTQRDYCKSLGINYGTYKYWCRKYRLEEGSKRGTSWVKPGFVPLEVSGSVAGSPCQIRFECPNGSRLHLSTVLDDAGLRALKELVLFKYDKSRSIKAPQEFLHDFNGTLQSDGYRVYQNIKTTGTIKRLSCMAHARRYFEKALDNDQPRAAHALEQIQILHGLEAKARERQRLPAVKQWYREHYATPLLERLHKWMQGEYS